MPRLRSRFVVVYTVRPAAVGLEFLLLQRPPGHRFAGAWQAVGGHIEERKGETAWQAALRESDEETGLVVQRWFRIDRMETFYNLENDTIYFVPAFAAVAAAGAEPTLSHEHSAWRWATAEDAAASVDWQAIRDSILLVAEALRDLSHPGFGMMEFFPAQLEARLARRAPANGES